MKKLELYIHIPFCVRKCAYCDFLSAPAGKETQETYFEALKEEIRQFPENTKENYIVTSVFFGGGTPSIVPAEWIAEILSLLREEFIFADSEKYKEMGQPNRNIWEESDTGRTVEISLECNPGTANEAKFQIYRSAGINRLSFGLQSADNRELQLLGRIHSWEEFVDTYHAARRAGFENINVDLMSALPGQTVESWEETLRKVLALQPEHISAYSLIIEEGTPFYEQYEEDAEKRDRGEQPELLPSEEDERRMYELTEAVLKESGMHRYEISNYAFPGRECRHNVGYWDGTEYIGFGLGSSSMMCISVDNIRNYFECCGNISDTVYSEMQCSVSEEDKYDKLNRKKWNTAESNGENQESAEDSICLRIRNTENLVEYLQKDFSQREINILTTEDRMSEFMFVGLRMMRGVSEAEFVRKFGRNMEEVYGEILKKQQSLGLVARENGRVFLTAKGIDVSNMVMSEFLF